MDFASCKIETEDAKNFGYDDGTVLNFTWPSGAKTVLILANGKFFLNGFETLQKELMGFDGCYYNPGTTNYFCYSKQFTNRAAKAAEKLKVQFYPELDLCKIFDERYLENR